MPKYAVVETTNLKAVHFAERILDAVCDEPVENGTFGYLEGTDDIKTFKKGFKAGEPVVMAKNPEWTLDMVNSTSRAATRRDKFIIEAGVPFRAFTIAKGDTFAISIEGVTTASQADMKKDAYVTIDATTGKLVASATSNASASFEAVVEKERLHGGLIETTAHNYGYTSKMYECTVKKLA